MHSTGTTQRASQTVRAPIQYGRDHPFRNFGDVVGKLRGDAPAARTLREGGVDQTRVDTVAARLAPLALAGAPAADALIENKSINQRKALKSSATSFGAMAYKGSFGTNGLIARAVTQATTDFPVPDALGKGGANAGATVPPTSGGPTPPPQTGSPSSAPSAPPSPAPSAAPSAPPTPAPSPVPSSLPTAEAAGGADGRALGGGLRGLQARDGAAAPSGPSLADRTRDINKTVFLNVISSAVHAAAGASAAPDDSISRLVQGPDARDVTAKEVAASFAPFGQRAVKNMGSVRTVTTAISAGIGQAGGAAYAAGRQIETAANSIGAYAVGRDAATKTAEIVFTRRAEADWSVQTPIKSQDGSTIGAITAHPEPVAKPDGRVELGKVKVHDAAGAREITVHRPSAAGPTIDVAPVDSSPGAAPKILTTSDRVKLWSTAVFGDWSGPDSLVDKIKKNAPTSATLTKMGAHASGIAIAAYAQPLITEGVKAVLERAGAPPNLAPYLATLATGIASDAIVASTFIPGFQNHGDPVPENRGPVRTALAAAGKIAFASTPILNAAGTGHQEHAKNVVMDDVTFARTAATETEMLAILASEIPGSVGYDGASGALELTDPNAVTAYAQANQPAPPAPSAAAPAPAPAPATTSPATTSAAGSGAAASLTPPSSAPPSSVAPPAPVAASAPPTAGPATDPADKTVEMVELKTAKPAPSAAQPKDG